MADLNPSADGAPPSTRSPAVLILEPDSATGRSIEQALRDEGFEVSWLRDPAAARKRVSSGGVDVAILDETLARSRSLFEELRGLPDPPSTIVVSRFGSVEGAVAAMRDGASHYAAKPLAPAALVVAVRKAADERRLRSENRQLRAEVERRSSLGALAARDPRMREIFALVETVAQTRATVLLLGESGTGKSVLARAIHSVSPRRAGPFVEVNCGALPESLLESELFGHAKGSFTGAVKERAGRFEVASGGTIFLDEIGTAPPSLQVRLLRVLQERVVERVGETNSRPVDVRVVLATNRDLAEEVRVGRFREDLYYRIHVVAIELPPLRERKADVPELVREFLGRASATFGRAVESVDPAAMERLLAHPWPGNVRELENAIERAAAVSRGSVLRLEDLPPAIARAGAPAAAPAPERAAGDSERLDDVKLGALEEMLSVCERRFIARALEACGNNRTRAAAMLGLHRATLYERMRRVGIPTDHRP